MEWQLIYIIYQIVYSIFEYNRFVIKHTDHGLHGWNQLCTHLQRNATDDKLLLDATWCDCTVLCAGVGSDPGHPPLRLPPLLDDDGGQQTHRLPPQPLQDLGGPHRHTAAAAATDSLFRLARRSATYSGKHWRRLPDLEVIMMQTKASVILSA